jgi:hypothetical protein
MGVGYIMWVKFYADSGRYAYEEKYFWEDNPDPEALSSELEDWADRASRNWERVSAGYDLLEALPPEVHADLLEEFTRRKAYAEKMLAHLAEVPPPPRKYGARMPQPLQETVGDRPTAQDLAQLVKEMVDEDDE